MEIINILIKAIVVIICAVVIAEILIRWRDDDDKPKGA